MIVDYFVSPANGSDTAGNGSLAAPWKSTQKALNTIVRNVNGGDRVNIQQGASDVLAASLSLTAYGTPTTAGPLILEGYAVSQGDGGVGDISGNSGGFVLISAASGVPIGLTNLHLHHSGNAALVALSTTYAVATNCEFDHCTAGSVVQVCQAVNCYFHDCGGAVRYLLGSAKSCRFIDLVNSPSMIMLVQSSANENVIATNNSRGIMVNIAGAVVQNNSIYSAGYASNTWEGINDQGLDGVVILNNIVEGYSGVGQAGIRVRAPTGGVLGGNRVFNCTTPYAITGVAVLDDGSDLTLTASPFKNPSAGDLTLNSDPNGGVLCDGTHSYPSGFQGGARTQWRAIGAIQPPQIVCPPPPPPPTAPNTPSILVIDKGDGTGATAIITGSAPGSVTTINALSVGVGMLGPAMWIVAGSIAGDGTVNLPLGKGTYIGFCESVVDGLPSEPSNPIAFNVTGGATPGNPFTLIFDGLWALLESNPQFVLDVPSGNRIKYNIPQNRDPFKQQVAVADLPEVVLVCTSAQGFLHNSSSTCRCVRGYSILISTGDFRVNELLHQVEWDVFTAMFNWRTALSSLKWNNKSFIKRLDLTQITQGLSDKERNRGIQGWSAVWGCEVEMVFNNTDLQALIE